MLKQSKEATPTLFPIRILVCMIRTAGWIVKKRSVRVLKAGMNQYRASKLV